MCPDNTPTMVPCCPSPSGRSQTGRCRSGHPPARHIPAASDGPRSALSSRSWQAGENHQARDSCGWARSSPHPAELKPEKSSCSSPPLRETPSKSRTASPVAVLGEQLLCRPPLAVPESYQEQPGRSVTAAPTHASSLPAVGSPPPIPKAASGVGEHRLPLDVAGFRVLIGFPLPA